MLRDQARRRLLAVALAVTLSACAPGASAPASTAVPTLFPAGEAEAAAPVIVANEGALGPTDEPISEAALPTPQFPPAPARVRYPEVTLTAVAFPISAPTAALVRVAPSAELERKVRAGLQMYLHQLDTFRTTGNENQLWAPPRPFRDLLVTGLRDTMRTGVVREFELVGLRIDAAYQKPWGNDAMVDVTVTIRDKVIAGNAREDSETGRLRLAGESRLNVIDGWNAAGGRWYNGLNGPTRSALEDLTRGSVSNYLWFESWVPGSQTMSYASFWGQSTAFAKWWDGAIGSIDRTVVTTRTFDAVSARIMRFDPSTELGDGVATVEIGGTVVTMNADASFAGTPFHRVVRVYVPWWGLGTGRVSVIDEQTGTGAWHAGGALDLAAIDREFG